MYFEQLTNQVLRSGARHAALGRNAEGRRKALRDRQAFLRAYAVLCMHETKEKLGAGRKLRPRNGS